MNKDIWEEIQAGNRKAFKQLFDEYYSPLCIYANSVLNNMEISQDVVSDCFVRIWEKKAEIKITSSIKHYLLSSVRNAIYSYLRSPESRKVDIESIESKLESVPIEEYNLEKEASIQHLSSLIEELPEQRKKILKMAAFGGKTYKEIAKILDISENTVNTQMSRAYRFLREKLGVNKLLMWLILKNIKKV
nr:RNA polymerase sigma-70 factor [uncultured Draconibacterium sp.]